MKLLLITPDVNHRNILQTYVGNMSYNLVKFCDRFNINYVNDHTIMEGIKQNRQDYSDLIDALNVNQFDGIILTGLCSVDRFLPASFTTYIKSKMKVGALLCQTSDYPVNSSRADLTFSTKQINGMAKSHYIGWGADPSYYYSNKKNDGKIRVLIDHTHYVAGEYDNTQYILDSLKRYNDVEVKRIGNNGKVLGPNDPVEVYDRSGLPNDRYKELLAESDVFMTTHAESVGLSVLEAAMSGCLVVSEQGHIFKDRLATIKHIEYPRGRMNFQFIKTIIDAKASRDAAINNTWDHVFSRMMEPFMNFKKMTLDEIKSRKAKNDMPYVTYLENVNSPDMLVYFGNYNGHIRGISTIEALNCNALIVRSDEATWYLQEFAHGKTPEEVAKSFDSFINLKPHIKNVVYGGFSMGAFASLLYGSFAKRLDKIVATSPQTTFPDFEVSGKIPVINPAYSEYASIKNIWDAHGVPDVEILLQACNKRFAGEGYKDYQECLELTHNPKVTLKGFDCEGHNGISYHLLNDLDYYNGIFRYAPPNLEA